MSTRYAVNLDIREVVAAYTNGDTLAEIAEATNCSAETIRKRLVAAGVKIRPRGRTLDPNSRHYRSVIARGHPLAGSGRLVGEHRLLLYDKIGPGPHACHWCGTKVEWMQGVGAVRGSLVVDHIDANRHNNSLDNLVPSCPGCNMRRGATNLVSDDEVFTERGGFRRRALQRRCATCGAPFLVERAETRPNRGIYCSRSCARKAQHRAS